jgi:hypothetical protein
MSIAPLSARLFRFLAVVASAAFIVIMLGTGSHANQPKYMSLSTNFCSKLLQHQTRTHRRLAEDDSDDCQKCIRSYIDRERYIDRGCDCSYHPQDCEANCYRAGRFWCQQTDKCPADPEDEQL